jgi:hypothetical protein
LQKAVKETISEIGTLKRRFKTHLRKKYVSEEETPFVKHAFLQQQDRPVHVCAGNQFSSHNKPHKRGRKCYRGKKKEWEEEDAKLAAEGKQNPWGQFLGRSRPYLQARVGKKRKNTSEGSGGITFSNPEVVGVAHRVKTLAAQGSDGSFSRVRENNILTAGLRTLDHRGQVRGVSSSLGYGKGFGEEFPGMYRKKEEQEVL